MSTARQRLEDVLPAAGLSLADDSVLLESNSNDVWAITDPDRGTVVLRICWRGDRQRMLREAAVGRELSRVVGYPEVLAAGAVPAPAGLT
ncbi:hypothetical protein [Arthrobacter sp. 35W]|uniref:hypothetical protein n=1 Tax=Arthrobacter sp. 35W TaxID=1132441 RepID=UPI00040A4AC8|nr:hypothetical protein [Arthrobacter sp. 35W]